MNIHKRDELQPLERAVSNALDKWLMRVYGLVSSWTSPDEFIIWLKEEGYEIRKIEEV